jgi:transcriptional regulator with XRE-family HTH domain
MEFNYAKLIGRIKEYGFTHENLANKIGIAPSTFSVKLNNKYAFTIAEIDAICKALDISKDEIGLYFFTQKVQKAER